MFPILQWSLAHDLFSGVTKCQTTSKLFNSKTWLLNRDYVLIYLKTEGDSLPKNQKYTIYI